MKKLLLATTALAALSGSALAADLPARTYTKAPPPVVAPSWTGFYLFGGGGGGIWSADTFVSATASGIPGTIHQRMGGDGYFGTVGAGYDWQISPSWVFGIFGDGQFGSLKGNIQDPTVGVAGITGNIRMRDAYAGGVRLGYLVAPNVLSYVNGGYTGSNWSGSSLYSTFSGFPVGAHTDSFNRNGFFFGGGVENNLSFFGINAPGWFMKTEYRSAYYERKAINERFDGSNALVGRDINFKPWVQTISTSLVYRFNWSGPVVAKY